MSKIPKEESIGEAAFALHCRAEKIRLIPEFRFDPERRWRFDFVIPQIKGLAIEIEGSVFTAGRHSRGVGMEADMEKYNRASILGWKVLRYSTGMVLRGDAIRDVLQILADGIEKGDSR